MIPSGSDTPAQQMCSRISISGSHTMCSLCRSEFDFRQLQMSSENGLEGQSPVRVSPGWPMAGEMTGMGKVGEEVGRGCQDTHPCHMALLPPFLQGAQHPAPPLNLSLQPPNKSRCLAGGSQAILQAGLLPAGSQGSSKLLPFSSPLPPCQNTPPYLQVAF